MMKSIAKLLLLTTALLSAAPSVAAPHCDGACFKVGPRLASIDSSESQILDLVLGSLLDSGVAIELVDADGLAQVDVDLVRILSLLSVDASVVNPQSVLDARNVTLTEYFTAVATAVAEQGFVIGGDSGGGLFNNVSLGVQTFSLGDLIKVSNGASVMNVQLDALSLIILGVQAFNAENVASTGTAPTQISLTPLLTPLGLAGVVDGLAAQLSVIEPPTIGCGPEGTTLYSAAIRLKLDIDLLSTQDATLLALLGIPAFTSLTLLDPLELYLDVAQAEATLDSVDPVTLLTGLTGRFGLVNAFLGEIPDATFFNRTQSAADLDAALTVADIASLDLDLNAVGLGVFGSVAVVDVDAKASTYDAAAVVATSPLALGPIYPDTTSAGSSTTMITQLISDLVSNVNEPGNLVLTATVLGIELTPVTNLVLTYATDLLEDIVEPLINLVIDPVLRGVADELLRLLGITIGEVHVTVFGVDGMCSVTVSPFNDLDGDQTPDAGETWDFAIPLTTHVENSAGSRLHARPLPLPATQWQFTGLSSDELTITLTSAPSPVAAGNLPAGWAFTQTENGRYTSIDTSSDGDGNDQTITLNVALRFTGISVQGLVFLDTGSGGGTANDIVMNGAELPVANASVVLLNDSDDSQLQAVLTRSDGTFTLSTDVGSTDLRLRVETSSGQLDLACDVGDTSGTNPNPNEVLWSATVGTQYSGVSCARVPVSVLTAPQTTRLSDGETRYLGHTFLAGTDGSLEIGLTELSNDGAHAWQDGALLIDTNCDGAWSPTETTTVSLPRAMTAAELLCLLLPTTAPAAELLTPSHRTLRVAASFTLTNRPSVVLQPEVVHRLIWQNDAGTLSVAKTVNTDTVSSGDTLTYNITIENTGTEAVADVVILDQVPAFTSLTTQSCGDLTGSGLSNCVASAVSDDLRWTFDGSLAAGQSIDVQFTVTVD